MAELDDQLRKIQGLIDKAHGTDNDHEARAFLAKADELMLKYSVEASMLDDPNRPNYRTRPVEEPELREVVILTWGDGGESRELDYYTRWALERVFNAVCRHLFIRQGPISKPGVKRIVGYPTDLRFAEMFFLKIKMHMFSEMITTVDSSKPWVEVMVGLKNMGYKWQDVHYKLCAHDQYPYRDQGWERRIGVAFTGHMKRWTEEHGTPRNKSSNPDAWRADYVDGYVIEIESRLWAMRQASLSENNLLPDLIEGKKSRVEEKFYDLFPDLRPHPDTCECDDCHFIKCNDESCTRPRCVNARKPVKSSGRTYYRNLNLDARSAGRSAGSRADLTDRGPIG